MGFLQKYPFFCDCVNLPEDLVEALVELKETAEDLDYEEFLRYVAEEQLEDFGFDPPLNEDWSVSFGMGSFDGWPCVFFVHSGIEHLFVAEDYTSMGGPQPPPEQSYLKKVL